MKVSQENLLVFLVNRCTCYKDHVSCSPYGCEDICTTDQGPIAIGDIFPAGDGCNTCICMEAGDVGPLVACTLKGCLQLPDIGSLELED